MFYLSLDEREELARFIVKKVKKRIPIIASGHVSNTIECQIEEIERIISTGVSAVVLLVNRFASQDESDDIWKKNFEKFLTALSNNVLLGLYECPYPYKRLISPALIKWCISIDRDRFVFLKDTSCDINNMREKLKVTKGSSVKIFNANSATLLQSLRDGMSGYCGLVANLCPELYVWLIKNWSIYPRKAQELQDFLGAIAPIEKRLYPICAKEFLQLEGLNVNLNTRSKNISEYLPSYKLEIKQLRNLCQNYIKKYKLIK
jgi:4-hydroxy-tetrahydrodipicolinate synthase